MSEHDPRERAYSRTRGVSGREEQAAAALARRHGRPIEPGDLCALPATADFPVEWAVVERGLDDPGRLLAVPADTFPPAGTGDVEIPESDPAGPLRLRCRHALWVDERTFGTARRTGVLAARWLRAAGALHEALAAGPLPPSSLAEEIDAETEYRDWERDVLAPARAALEREAARIAAAPGNSAPASPAGRPPRAWRSLPARLAAVFLLGLIGLGAWNARLRSSNSELQEQLAEPSVGAPILLAGTQRGSSIRVPVTGDATHVLLLLQPDEPIASGQVEIRAPEGRVLWRSRPVAAALELVLTAPRLRLPDGSYQVVLVDAEGRSVQEWWIEVTTEATP